MRPFFFFYLSISRGGGGAQAPPLDTRLLCTTSHVGIGHLGTLVYHSFRFRGILLFNAMPKQIRDLSCSVSSFKYQLDKYLSTIPDSDTPCIANYDNSLENSSHTNPHLLTGVHPV